MNRQGFKAALKSIRQERSEGKLRQRAACWGLAQEVVEGSQMAAGAESRNSRGESPLTIEALGAIHQGTGAGKATANFHHAFTGQPALSSSWTAHAGIFALYSQGDSGCMQIPAIDNR
jgi:hypothetical protein